MAFYQKYRPQSLDELVGQDFVRQTLESALKNNAVAHAYLFFGSRGTGKTSTARILAREIILEGIPESEHESAKESILRGNFVDLIEIDGASNRKIEHARSLIEKINFAPSLGTRKVYIIDEVHMLTKEAFNALLKTIEEPPEHAFFLLATTELHKVPDTIKSRCQVFSFQRFSHEQIAGRLTEIAGKEGIEVEQDALFLIAKKSLGGLRDAIGLFEQASTNGAVTTALLQEEWGLAAEGAVEDFLQLLSEQETAKAIEYVSDLANSGIALPDFAEQILSLLRDKMLECAEKKEGEQLAHILELIDLFEEARKKTGTMPIPTLPLEIAIVTATVDMKSPQKSGWSLFGGSEKKSEVKKEAPEIKLTEEPITPLQNSTSAESPAPSAVSLQKELTKEILKESWKEIVSQVASPVIKVALHQARVQLLRENEIGLIFSSQSFRKQVEEKNHFNELIAVVQKIFGEQVTVSCSTTTVSLEPVEKAEAKEEKTPVTPEMISEIFGAQKKEL